jgi:hypothetical protein
MKSVGANAREKKKRKSKCKRRETAGRTGHVKN